MSEVKLGTKPTEEGLRDAVHVPVIVVRAGTALYVGQRVAIVDGKAFRCREGIGIGIVDPFGDRRYEEGELVYVCLLPGNIKSLRHHWVHPDVPETTSPSVSEVITNDVEESKRWLREYAMRLSPYVTQEAAYALLLDGLANGELFGHGTDLHDYGDLVNPDELRFHAERLLGKQIDLTTFEFHCSC